MSHPIRTSPGARRSIALLTLLALSPAAALAEEPAPPASSSATSSADDRILFQVVPAVSGCSDGCSTALRNVPVLARDGRLLAGEELYLRLGRPDLVAELHVRETRRNVLLGLGAAITVGGLVYMVSVPGPDMSMSSSQFGQAMKDQEAGVQTGMAVSLVGSLVMVVGLLTNPNPVDEAELHRLIDDHNRALQGDGPPRVAAPTSAAGAQVTFQAGPIPGGAMAGLSLAF
jgi:hypothetical protein